MATFVGTTGDDTITPQTTPGTTDADDSIVGGAGRDSLDGGGGNDTIEGGAGIDTLRGSAGNDSLNGGDGDDILDGGSGADTMNGGAGNDTYYVDGLGDQINEAAGGGTDNVIVSTSYVLAAGVDVESMRLTTTGDTGFDVAGNGSYLVGNEKGGQTLTGNDFDNIIDGGRNSLGAAGDTLIGNGGNDTFAVRNPLDQVIGGAGTNTVYVDPASLVAGGQIVASWSATATGSTGINLLSAADQSAMTALNLTGNTEAQIVAGNMGKNVLNGGGGQDTLIGLGGDDTYVVAATDSGNVTIQEAAGDNDALNVTGTGNFNLSTKSDTASIETIRVEAGFNATLTGNSVSQTLDASLATGSVTLIGGGGADTLIGGQDVDTFVVDSADDVIQDRLATTGTTSTEANTVSFSGAKGGFDLADDINVSVIQTSNAAGAADATGTGDVYLVGNNFNQRITGNAGNNILDGQGAAKSNATGATAAGLGDTLDGGAGNDIYRIYTENDRVIDASGTDIIYTSSATTNLTVVAAASAIETLSAFDQSSSAINYALTGDANDQRIIGAQGNDTLVGGGGKDTLIGLGGDDRYTITANATQANNTVIQEAAGGGNDVLTLVGSESYTLGKGVEIERINVDATFNDTLKGNEFNQVLDASAVTIGTQNVTLNGGGGTDTLIGGAGNDTFIVDDASDVIIDTKGGPNSIQFSGSGGYDLAAGVNVTSLSVATGNTNSVYLVGNEFSQTITGGSGNDILNGDGGLSGATDTLIGGAGDDIYRVWNAGDVVQEGAGGGFDTVYTSVNYALGTGQEIEQLSASDQSATGAITLIGNAGANRIIGNQGANILAGGDGQDVLIGLGGADTFSFANVGVANVDTIQYCNRAEGDKIQLVNADGAATGTAGRDNLFDLGTTFDANELTFGTAAVGTNAQIVYDQSTGRLFYDNDGAGGADAVLFAQLTPGTELTASDFTIVATAPSVP